MTAYRLGAQAALEKLAVSEKLLQNAITRARGLWKSTNPATHIDQYLQRMQQSHRLEDVLRKRQTKSVYDKIDAELATIPMPTRRTRRPTMSL